MDQSRNTTSRVSELQLSVKNPILSLVALMAEEVRLGESAYIVPADINDRRQREKKYRVLLKRSKRDEAWKYTIA